MLVTQHFVCIRQKRAKAKATEKKLENENSRPQSKEGEKQTGRDEVLKKI